MFAGFPGASALRVQASLPGVNVYEHFASNDDRIEETFNNLKLIQVATVFGQTLKSFQTLRIDKIRVRLTDQHGRNCGLYRDCETECRQNLMPSLCAEIGVRLVLKVIPCILR